MWSFQGKLIRKHQLDNFCQLLWRPRPPSLLTTDVVKKIKRDLKKYSADFDIKDRMAISRVSKEILEKRKQAMDEFRRYSEQAAALLESRKQELLELRALSPIDSPAEESCEEETIEFLVKQDEIVLTSNDSN